MWGILRTWITADSLALAVFVVSYLGYPVYGRLAGHGIDRRLRVALLRELRTVTAHAVASESGRALLVASFQTYVRALVFLGVSSSLAFGGSLGLLMNPQRAGQLCALSFFAEATREPDIVRLRMVVFSLLAGYSFVLFVWGIKALYHLTFAVHTQDPTLVAPFLDHLDQDFTRGVRTLYYLYVFFLGFFGPEFLLAGSLLLTIMLWRYDVQVLREP